STGRRPSRLVQKAYWRPVWKAAPEPICLHAINAEAHGSRRGTQRFVMRREHETVVFVLNEQRTREMQRIKRPDRCRKGIGSPLEHGGCQGDEVHGVDDLEDVSAVACDGGVIEPQLDPGSVNRAKALDADELAGYSDV